MIEDNRFVLHQIMHENGRVHDLIVRSDFGGQRRYVAYAEIIESIIHMAHLRTGHKANRTTHNFIANNFTHISRELVIEFISRCQYCADRLALPKKTRGSNTITEDRMFGRVVIDLVDYSGGKAGGDREEYNYLFHLVDHQSSFHYTAALKNKSAQEVLQALRNVFALINYPEKVHSDNGSEFENKLVRDYLEEHHIECIHGKPYHPETQGKVERSNRTIQEIIAAYIYERKKTHPEVTWLDVYCESTAALNANVTCSTKVSPYEFVFGQQPINYKSIEALFVNGFAFYSEFMPLSSQNPAQNIHLLTSNVAQESNEHNPIIVDNVENSETEMQDNDNGVEEAIEEVMPQIPLSTLTDSLFNLDIAAQNPILPTISAPNPIVASIPSPTVSFNNVASCNEPENESQSDENYRLHSEDRARKRQVAISNYFQGALNTQIKMDRLNKSKLLQYSIGDIVGLTIPEEIRLLKVNKLPVVVFEKNEASSGPVYKLGSMGSIIVGWFDATEFVQVKDLTYATSINATTDPKVNLKNLKGWKKYSNGKIKPEVPLRTIYKRYIDKHYINQNRSARESSTSSAALLIDSSTNINPILLQSNISSSSSSSRKRKIISESPNVSGKKLLKEDQCAACRVDLTPDMWHRCSVCNHRMHNHIKCDMRSQISFVEVEDGPPLLFCSAKCKAGNGDETILNYSTTSIEQNSNVFLTINDESHSNSSSNNLVPHPRNPPASHFPVGSMVYLKIPSAVQNQHGGNIERIPVIVIEHDYIFTIDEYIYSVAVKKHTVLGPIRDAHFGWFPATSLSSCGVTEFPKKKLFGMRSTLLTQSMVNNWGYLVNTGEYRYVPVEEAYKMFLQRGNYDGVFEYVLYRALEK